LTAAMTAARMVAMLAGPLPVRLVEASSPNAVSLIVVCLDGPVLADQAAQVLRGGVRAGEAGDGVDSLARGLAGGGLLPPAGGAKVTTAPSRSRASRSSVKWLVSLCFDVELEVIQQGPRRARRRRRGGPGCRRRAVRRGRSCRPGPLPVAPRGPAFLPACRRGPGQAVNAGQAALPGAATHRGQIPAVRTRFDHARSHARQCHCGHARIYNLRNTALPPHTA